VIEEENDLGVIRAYAQECKTFELRQCAEAAKEAISTVCTIIRKTINRVKDTI